MQDTPWHACVFFGKDGFQSKGCQDGVRTYYGLVLPPFLTPRFSVLCEDMCNHHVYLILEHFIIPSTLCSLAVIPTPSPRLPLIFLPAWNYRLCTFHTNGSIQFVDFSDHLLSLSIVFVGVHPCCSMHRYSTPFYSQILLYDFSTVHPFSCWWIPGFFPLFYSYKHIIARNVCVTCFMWTCF